MDQSGRNQQGIIVEIELFFCQVRDVFFLVRNLSHRFSALLTKNFLFSVKNL